ncbi:MAG: hypothetical protein H0W72_04090 [Planctomycetes bacterium]|nr:hypothetical protein [Planctomycetota bacterium]
MAVAWNQLDKRQQYTVLIAVPVLLGFLLGYLIYGVLGKIGPKPELLIRRQGGPDAVYTQILDLDAQIAEKQVIIDEEPKIDQRLKDLQDDIADAEERLPLEAEKSQMRELLEKLARGVPSTIGVVEFKSVRINEGAKERGEKKAEYQSIIYQIELAGELNGIIKYIDSIEKNARFMAVKTLSIKPGEMSIDTSANKIVVKPHTVNMELITYYYTQTSKKRAR